MDVASKLRVIWGASAQERPVIVSSNLRPAPEPEPDQCVVRSRQNMQFTRAAHAHAARKRALSTWQARLFPHGRSVALGEHPALLAILSHCLLSDDDATR